MLEGLSFDQQKEAQEILEAIKFFSLKGWSPATSTNYSLRLQNDRFLISRSGVDKSQFKLNDLIHINSKGEIYPEFQKPGVKSSAETMIHTSIYARFPDINCVLHTHSVLGTWLSQKFAMEKAIHFNGWELLKGLAGIDTHLTTVTLPIVYNHQDMETLMNEMEYHWAYGPMGFLIAGHGLYTWGRNVFEAKRHIETFEFLFELKKLEK